MAGALHGVQVSRRSELLPTPFHCTWRLHGVGSAWVAASGELDLAVVAELDDALRSAATSSKLVVLDLGALEFIDLAGVHAIVDASLRILLDGGRLIIGFAPAPIASAFALTGTADAVEILELLPSSRPPRVPLQLV